MNAPSLNKELVAQLQDALNDILNGWRYIRRFHGELYGVGWDRADEKAAKALAALATLSSTQESALPGEGGEEALKMAIVGTPSKEGAGQVEARKAVEQLADRIDQAGGGPLYIDHVAASHLRALAASPAEGGGEPVAEGFMTPDGKIVSTSHAIGYLRPNGEDYANGCRIVPLFLGPSRGEALDAAFAAKDAHKVITELCATFNVQPPQATLDRLAAIQSQGSSHVR